MPKPKKKSTPEQKREKKRRREVFETVFVSGKQKRVRREPRIEGTSVSAMVREFLNSQVEDESMREARRRRAMKEFFEAAEARADYNRKPGEPIRRDEIHDGRIR